MHKLAAPDTTLPLKATVKADPLVFQYARLPAARPACALVATANPGPLFPTCACANRHARRSYMVDMGVCFLVLCDSYPRMLAFSYLLELQKAFFDAFTHSDVQSAQRPYQFIQFGATRSRAGAEPRTPPDRHGHDRRHRSGTTLSQSPCYSACGDGTRARAA